MMSGLGIENSETIMIDSKANVYDGPRGLFKIVVDDFDGKIIRSWHIEDKYGEKSRNLGGEQCKSLDTVVGEVGLYMGGQVMTNIYGQVYNNLNWTKPKSVNRLMQENQRLKSMGESTRK
jgi:hypothetical protein